jgi:2-amino-4-hydroxy-6-hydroxymethyldihydropteridine diphosphokinase
MPYDIILSLASNCQQQQNLAEARKRLGQVLFDLSYTKELWSEPFHASPDKPSSLYLNQLLYARTELQAADLNEKLKKTEADMGRTPQLRAQGIVPIDLDLLLHDGTRYHLPDWERPYIKELLR